MIVPHQKLERMCDFLLLFTISRGLQTENTDKKMGMRKVGNKLFHSKLSIEVLKGCTFFFFNSTGTTYSCYYVIMSQQRHVVETLQLELTFLLHYAVVLNKWHI